MTDSNSPTTTSLTIVFADDSGLSHDEVVADLHEIGFAVPDVLDRLMQTVNESVAAAKQARMREARTRLDERRRTSRPRRTAPLLDRQALIQGILSFGRQAAAFHRKLDLGKLTDVELASLLEDLEAVNRSGDEEE